MPHTCPFCGGTCLRTLSPASSDHTYRLCAACGAGHIDPMPADPTGWYTRDYFVDGGARAGYLDYDADARWHRRTATLRLRRLEERLDLEATTPRRLVDVGTATGHLLDVATDMGWSATGIETSRWAADRARARGHLVHDDLTAVPDEPLGAVTFFQSLEHLPDPAAALRRAADLLAPGGVVLCETWDLGSRTARLAGNRWQQLSPPSVLWLFTRPAMDRLARQAGLQLVSWHRSPKLVSLATVLGQSIPATNRGTAARAARTVGQRVPIPYPLDDLVTTALVKPRTP